MIFLEALFICTFEDLLDPVIGENVFLFFVFEETVSQPYPPE